jgi:uncharacterized membrane protein
MESNTLAFEDRFAGVIAVLSGLVWAFVSLAGPLAFNLIRYKTSPSALFQAQGQELVNLVLVVPVCMIGGILAIRRSRRAGKWLSFLPVYMMYSAIAFGIGMEWSDPRYTGNSHRFAFLFVFEMIAGLILLLYTLERLKAEQAPEIGKKGKVVYSVLFIVFLTAFAAQCAASLVAVARTGTSAEYDAAPTLFWTIRILDLGVSIPLGFLSVYLLWTRPRAGFVVQLLFYGFFIVQVTAVLTMIAFEVANRDPNVDPAFIPIFCGIAAIVYCGYFFITKKRRVTI